MADKTPVLYTEAQEKSIRHYISQIFGEKEWSFCYLEVNSEYVHIDLMTAGDEERALVTVGMGARAMNCLNLSVPDKLARIELAMHMRDRSEEKENTPPVDEMLVASELVRLSKYPFEYDTVLLPGTIIDASETFERVFGYKYFMIMACAYDCGERLIKELGTVNFFSAAPIYEDEYEWVMNNKGLSRFYTELSKLTVFEDTLLCVDNRREHIIPSDSDDGASEQ